MALLATLTRNSELLVCGIRSGFRSIVLSKPPGALGSRPMTRNRYAWDTRNGQSRAIMHGSTIEYTYRGSEDVPVVVCGPYCGPPPHSCNCSWGNIWSANATPDCVLCESLFSWYLFVSRHNAKVEECRTWIEFHNMRC